MRRFLAFLLAALMMLPLCLSAVAVADSVHYFSVYTGGSSKTYNPDRRVTVSLSLRDISFGNNDGISAFEFELYYDKNMLTPVTAAAEDNDGDKGDFTKLMTTQPGNWEGFGKLDEEAGKYTLAFSDISREETVTVDDALVIKIPFQTNEYARVNNLVFNFDRVVAYNKNMESCCEIELDSVVVTYAPQPAVNATVPSDAIPLDVAGYRHDIANFIYYSKNGTTVSDFVKQYCDTNYNQDRLSTFAILIAGIDGVITYVNTSVGTSGNKSSVKIPAGSYIIGVNKENTEDYNEFKSMAKVGAQVTVYNVNIEATGMGKIATDLNRAAFAVYNVGEEPPFVGGNDPTTPIVPPDPDIEVPDPEDPDDSDPPSDIKPGDPGNSNDETSYLLGDVNRNDKIDMTDYILLKRAYFGTYTLNAEQQKRGDCNKNGKIDMTDYILLKRAYFGTYNLNG